MKSRRQKTIYLSSAKKKTRRAKKARITLAVIIAMSALIGLILALLPNAYEISIEGKVVGVVDKKELVQKAKETVKTQLESEYKAEVQLKTEPTLKKVHASKKDFITPSYLMSYMRDNMDFMIGLYELKVDEQKIGIVATKNSLDELMVELKKEYLEDETKQAEFANKVALEPIFAREKDVIDMKTLVDKCTETSKQKVEYEVVAGDSLSGIADKLGITMSKLLKYNKGLTETSTLKIGVKLQAEVDVPVLGIKEIELKKEAKKETKK